MFHTSKVFSVGMPYLRDISKLLEELLPVFCPVGAEEAEVRVQF
jgi:hypothetical protein